LLVTCGIVLTALIAPAASGKALLAGSRQAPDEIVPTLSGSQSALSWNDLLAGAAAGAVLAYLVMRALRAVRFSGRGLAIDARV
jgi:hypothetical protein